jgi:hypothetical protein
MLTVFLVLLVLLAAFLVRLWFATTALQTGTTGTVAFLGWHEELTTDSAFVIIALTAGGARWHLARDLLTGEPHRPRRLRPRWTTSYLTNPLAGAALATVFRSSSWTSAVSHVC